MSYEYKLAVVGFESSILLYKAIGAQAFPVTDAESAQVMVEQLFKSKQDEDGVVPSFAVIFVEETLYAELPAELINRFTNRPLPAVVPIPSPVAGDESYATKRMSKIIERAVGSDIFS
jgi:vacuolar-type H+-ATPase subunit F/Vma7